MIRLPRNSRLFSSLPGSVFLETKKLSAKLPPPLALAGGRLLMRSQEELKCVDLRRASSAD